MNEEADLWEEEAAGAPEDRLVEDADDRNGILNFTQKFQEATGTDYQHTRDGNNNKPTTRNNLVPDESSKNNISLRLVQLENSVDETEIKIPIKGQEHKKIINMGEKLIGDYKVEKTLGQGTFGKVK